jgi:septal ring factor EnvC (AmiA/AmiB activator)
MTKDTGHDCIDGIRKGYSAEYCELCLRQENEKLKAELAAAKQEIERLRKRIDGEWHAQDLLATDASNLNRERDTLRAALATKPIPPAAQEDKYFKDIRDMPLVADPNPCTVNDLYSLPPNQKEP